MSEQILTSCTNGGPIFVHVKDGKIVRVRPLVFDDNDAESWIIEANGRKFSPQRRGTLAAPNLTEKLRLDAETRLKYPLKRADFDPGGNRHAENRGKSGYKRISWDEAIDIVSSEIKRIQTTYGKAAITSIHSSHHSYGNIGYRSSAWRRFFRLNNIPLPVIK